MAAVLRLSSLRLYSVLVLICGTFFVIQVVLSRQLSSHEAVPPPMAFKSSRDGGASSNEKEVKRQQETMAPRSKQAQQDGGAVGIDRYNNKGLHDDASSSTRGVPKQQLDQQEHQPPPSSSSQSLYNKTNHTMSACLFIMDDTIRLMEWLAYHMTVLPLGHLVVAIDPKSNKQDEVLHILNQYRPYLSRLDAYQNDTWLTLAPEEGWGRQVHSPNGKYRKWFLEQDADTYKAQAHKRRQNFFFSYCLQSLFTAGSRTWTLLIDSDEFLVYNYRHAENENASIYDAETQIVTREHLDLARERILPLRDALPHFNERVTMADYLHHYVSHLNLTENVEVDTRKMSQSERQAYKVQAMKDHALETSGIKLDKRPKCLRFPHLRFSSYESNPKVVKNISTTSSISLLNNFDPMTIMTLRQRKVGAMEGLFSKAMLDLSQAKSPEWFNFKGVVNVHTPSRRMCGRTSKKDFSGSGTDYMSSLFRINHYRSGTIETYLERSGDYRGSSIWRFYAERNIQPESENDDIRPWIAWFIEKVGEKTARSLLLDPMEEAYRKYQQYPAYAHAKEVLDRLQGDNDPLEHVIGDGEEQRKKIKYNYTKTNKHMAACVLVGNNEGVMKLAEWIAYHYTVLPLGALVVGIDITAQSSSLQDGIRETVLRWKKRINVTVWSTNNEWLNDLKETDGFKKRTLDGGNQEMAWFKDKASDEFKTQAQQRRKHVFYSKCLAHHHNSDGNNNDWTAVVDPQEYVIFNYKGSQESPVRFDAVETNIRTKEDIIQQRTESSPIRDRLPVLTDRVTVADFLAHEQESIQKCLLMPGLEMGPRMNDLGQRSQHQELVGNLLTIRQNNFGIKRGRFTRALLDVSKTDDFGWRQVESEHNANLKLCPRNGKYEATDYIAALIRIQRYNIGSLETFFEQHASDPEHNDDDDGVLERYKNATDDFEPFGDDHSSVMPWFDWFLAKVGGEAAAKELLVDPLHKARTQLMKKHPIIKETLDDAVANAAADE